jgi:hypothetical protein
MPGEPRRGARHDGALGRVPDRGTPGSGRGLDIAREYGVADLDESGEWVVGDLSRLKGA